jgi:hypothetical protein
MDEQSDPKTRQLESLITQIKIDYQALCRLWEQFSKNMTDFSAIDPILQRIAWIRTAMEELNRYRNDNIEGILGGNLETIAMDIAAIQDQIRIRLNINERG